MRRGQVRNAIAKVPERVGAPTIDPEGDARANGDDVEITGSLDLRYWPGGMCVIIHRGRLRHPARSGRR